MGIYSDGKIYGVKLYFIDGETVFEKKISEEFGNNEIEEVKSFWFKLSELEKQKINIHLYTSCATTILVTNTTFMMWWPSSRATLEGLFYSIG